MIWVIKLALLNPSITFTGLVSVKYKLWWQAFFGPKNNNNLLSNSRSTARFLTPAAFGTACAGKFRPSRLLPESAPMVQTKLQKLVFGLLKGTLPLLKFSKNLAHTTLFFDSHKTWTNLFKNVLYKTSLIFTFSSCCCNSKVIVFISEEKIPWRDNRKRIPDKNE